MIHDFQHKLNANLTGSYKGRVNLVKVIHTYININIVLIYFRDFPPTLSQGSRLYRNL